MPTDPTALARLPLSQAPLAFVDVETTGLDPASGHRICEVAIVRCQGTPERGRVDTLVNPLRAISPGAFAVNGITPAMVARAPTFGQVAASVRAALDGAVIVGHNVPFDLSFLARELALAGETLPTGPALDTLALARQNCHFPSNSLGAVAAALGVRGGGHRALGDALTTREVFHRLIGRICPGDARVAEVAQRQGGFVGWPAAPANAVRSPRLAEALRPGETLRIWYLASDGAETVRLVDPVEVVERAGWPSLVAYCHLRQERRTFRLDRIMRWEPVPQPGGPGGLPAGPARR